MKAASHSGVAAFSGGDAPAVPYMPPNFSPPISLTRLSLLAASPNTNLGVDAFIDSLAYDGQGLTLECDNDQCLCP